MGRSPWWLLQVANPRQPDGSVTAAVPAGGVGGMKLEAGYRGVMGLIRGTFSLSNPTRPDLASLEVSALADSGAVHLCIPEHLAIQLSLAELERREVVLADGHRRTVPYVGPVEVRFRNRRCFTGAVVLGNEVLLGAIPMEDMDLVLRPQLQSVDVNPESPNIPLSVTK
ncbi:clan AA aspartic protease [Cyanobium sp. FGCU-6]|nr:clan AA aspartic protease [Cyanobium sp. FGCU6]